MYHESPQAKRMEVRFPDPSCNPYLAFSALLLAGLDGVQNEIDPGDPTDQNLYEMDEEKLSHIPHAPGSLTEALDALEKDHDFLTAGGVFAESFLADYIGMKRAEVDEGNMRPTPWEFYRYYDI